MRLFKRARQAFTAFQRYADDTKEYPAHQPLADGASGFGLVYEVNPVYLEAGQGGNSWFRGFGVLMILFGFFGALGGTIMVFYMSVVDFNYGRLSLGEIGLDVFFMLVLSFVSLITFLWVVPAFFFPVDIFTRYDRKRQKVWVWNPKQPIELDWNNLVPVVRGTAASAQLPVKQYRGMYVEYDVDGEIKQTRGVKHVVQVGSVTGGTAGALPVMEYVRRYMEEDISTLPPVSRLLRKRPPWWVLFNFAGIADDWHDYLTGRHLVGGLPWGGTLLYIIMFPVLFPLNCTNYLALRFAPLPKWPKDWLRMHQEDLRQLDPSAMRGLEFVQPD